MIDLKEACKRTLSEHNGQYIHCINEFQKCYSFIMIDVGYKAEDYSIICRSTIVDKETGQVDKDVLDGDKRTSGSYQQYTGNQIPINREP